MATAQQRIEILIAKGLKEVLEDTALLSSFMIAYKEVYGDKICGNCHKDLPVYYQKLVNWYHLNKNKKMSDKFKLKNGYSSPLRFGSRTIVSNSNLTNELAIEFLRENPSRASVFVELPSNWMELIAEAPPKTEQPGGKTPQIVGNNTPKRGKKPATMTADVPPPLKKIIIETK